MRLKQGSAHRGLRGCWRKRGINRALSNSLKQSVSDQANILIMYLWYALNISLKNAQDIFPTWELSTGGLYDTTSSFACLPLTNIRGICQTLQFKLSSYLKVYISFKVDFQHEKSINHNCIPLCNVCEIKTICIASEVECWRTATPEQWPQGRAVTPLLHCTEHSTLLSVFLAEKPALGEFQVAITL